jgi:hypothetical protein
MKVPAKIDPGGRIYSSTGSGLTVTVHPAEMYRNLKWYFGIGPLMLCSSSLNIRILGAVR